MNRPHFRRRPRPVDPAPEYSRLDVLDGLPGRGDAQWPDRYDVQWPDVRAAEVGGDLAAMAAPGDWPEFSGWGEGYEIEPEERAATDPDLVRVRLAAAVKPRGRHRQIGRGRHRQTDPLDLILADLRDLDGWS